MTKFRPCIDLHQGKVKQIVGGTLSDDPSALRTHFESPHDAAWFANLYRDDQLRGGHVIMLGPGNEEAAKSALAAWPDALQIGGGIHAENAVAWLEAGAAQIIVTSVLFDASGRFQAGALERLLQTAGKERLVLDLSCRRDAEGWVVAMNRWQTPTEMRVTRETLEQLAPCCSEFLIHAADVEGKCEGIDEALVRALGAWSPCPITYAGGGRSTEDLQLVQELSEGKVDLTLGSALDIFGGQGARYRDCVAFNQP